jgi:hypothetical protein
VWAHEEASKGRKNGGPCRGHGLSRCVIWDKGHLGDAAACLDAWERPRNEDDGDKLKPWAASPTRRRTADSLKRYDMFAPHKICRGGNLSHGEGPDQWSRSADQGGKAHNAPKRRGVEWATEEARRGRHGSQQQQRQCCQDGTGRARAAQEARQGGRRRGASRWVIVIAGSRR